jgi:uracil-DNA glycosylase
MTKEEYFGDWSKVIDLQEVDRILNKLRMLSLNGNFTLCPQFKDIFKAFHLCSLHSLRLVIIGLDPYPNLRAFPWDSSQGLVPVATGLAFANSSDTPENCLSPSLSVLMESVIDFTIPHRRITFDPDLEKWEEQGVLLLNSALTCQAGRIGSHTLLWRPFMKSLLTNLSMHSSGIVYVLMGSQARTLEPYINKQFNHVIHIRHPSWYAREHQRMPSDIWRDINRILIGQNGYGIEWYQEN